MKNLETTKIFLAGHNGMVGSSVLRKLRNFKIEPLIRERTELDLRSQGAVNSFFQENTVDLVILCAAKVGGILGNSENKADFLMENLAIQQNVIHAAHAYNVQNLIFLGSSCIYPKVTKIPIKENQLLEGPLEATNDAYAIAKIAGLKACQFLREQYGRNYFSLMPTNLYGPGDNFDPRNSHVLPALIKRVHDAKKATSPQVEVWGTGKPLREFMHVDDLARGIVHFAMLPDETINGVLEKHGVAHINIGSGHEVSIYNLAHLIKSITGYKGQIVFDPTKPDGTYRKLMDNSICTEVNWKAKISLEDGIRSTYAWMMKNIHKLREGAQS